MFKITREIIEPAPDPSNEAGAQVVFTGIVRNRNEGQSVESLEYEAHESLAVSEGEKILAEARSLYELEDVRCTHRVGNLQIGEVAVMVTATSAHRTASFDACQYVIDEVKRRVPIWKREMYADGESEWLNANNVRKSAR